VAEKGEGVGLVLDEKLVEGDGYLLRNPWGEKKKGSKAAPWGKREVG